MIRVKRVYDSVESDDGHRFLVDRLWPRGMKREALKLNGWMKEVAPGDNLRRWFGHDPEKWMVFRQRYFEELDSKPEVWQPLLEAAVAGPVTLLYGARDIKYNNAAALKDYLEARIDNKSCGAIY